MIDLSHRYLAVENLIALSGQSIGVLEQATQERVNVYFGSIVKADIHVWEV